MTAESPARMVAGAAAAGAAVAEAPDTAGAGAAVSAGRAVGVVWAGVATAALSACGACGRRDDGKSIGVTMMTIAISTSARTVRLSMQDLGVARERDRSRRAEMGGSEECGEWQASFRATRRVSPALQWHTRNSLDN